VSFDAKLNTEDGIATIRLSGELDAGSAPQFNELVSKAAQADPSRLVLLAADLSYMSSAGLRCLVLAQQKLPDTTEIVLVGAQPEVAETIRLTGFDQSVTMEQVEDLRLAAVPADMSETHLTVEGTTTPAEAIAGFVAALGQDAGLPREKAYWLRLAVEEITTNIIEHGYQGPGPIWLARRIEPACVSVRIEDVARAFDPRTHDRLAQLAVAPEERAAGGLGLFLALHKLDGFRYEYADGKNRSTLIMSRMMGT
jgi:anti-sigma B factor antagonist